MNVSSPNLRKNKIFFIIPLFLCFVLLEILLRIQQKLGPFYDLEFKQPTTFTLSGLSDILNHKNPAGEHRISLTTVKERMKYKKYFDSHGIQVNRLIPHYPEGQVMFKILFMGDSFMEGRSEEAVGDREKKATLFPGMSTDSSLFRIFKVVHHPV